MNTKEKELKEISDTFSALALMVFVNIPIGEALRQYDLDLALRFVLEFGLSMFAGVLLYTGIKMIGQKINKFFGIKS
ncbi:hypothetical protein ACMXYX_18095 (plasmid) [Neptuniibacter sp. QD72_48]|uniref:hypothetical protein n=1 Tax=Neptuniibacter sp. QD72_48 TaxID=3398214 RepID=UPI0039F53D7E